MKKAQRGLVATLVVLVVLLLAALGLLGVRAMTMAAWLAVTAQTVPG